MVTLTLHSNLHHGVQGSAPLTGRKGPGEKCERRVWEPPTPGRDRRRRGVPRLPDQGEQSCGREHSGRAVLGNVSQGRMDCCWGLSVTNPEEMPFLRSCPGLCRVATCLFSHCPLKTRKPKICLNQGEGRGHCIWWEQGGAVPTDLSTNTWGSCCVVPLSYRQKAFLWAGQSTQRGCSEDTGYSKWDLLPLFSVTCAPALCGQEALREAFSSHTASFPGQATTGHRSCLDFMPHLCFPSLIEN